MSPSTSTDAALPAALGALPRNAATHFKLCFHAAALHVIDELTRNLGSLEEVVEQFPFVRGYLDELEQLGAGLSPNETDWLAAIRQWESHADEHLPIRALRDVLGLGDREITLLFAIGLIEEDPRFGFLIECAQPVPSQQQRPTLSLLTAWWREGADAAPVRASIRTLLDAGLIHVLNADAPRLQWVFQSSPAVWDALRGELGPMPAPWLTFSRPDELPQLDDLVLDEALRRSVTALPELIRSGDVRALIVRGPRQNGRRTIIRAIARDLGRGVLELRGPLPPDSDRWSIVGALATLASAIPLVVLDLGLGETTEIPPLRGFSGTLAVAMGKHGGVSGAAVDGAVTIHCDLPGGDVRVDLWRNSLPADVPADAQELGRRFRMTSGNIRSAASLARSYARLDQRENITPQDVRVAGRALHRELETLATLIPVSGRWENLGASSDTLDELRDLEARCRHREELRDRLEATPGVPLNCGVRALFAGPSGTGKTMAARILGSMLQMDVYRLDLASVVNKYIGETEKSLHQLFSRAEELDVVLLIDEGDALLTSRTAVQSSNDRYANLETNFLLQRLESFDGVLIVTTNAANRIDSAFQRRMDVVVEFHLPDMHERWTIWQLHLPAGHTVDRSWLEDVAVRCELSGGQIRNAVLHAALLALDRDGVVSTGDVERAVHREYRKSGAVCPLQRSSSQGG